MTKMRYIFPSDGVYQVTGKGYQPAKNDHDE